MVRVGVIASIASFFVRSGTFRRLLLHEDRTLTQRIQLSAWFCVMFASGVVLRLRIRSYEPADLAFEGSFLSGLIGGYVTGLVSGLLISVPAMFNQEYVSMPLFAGIGLLGGMLRDIARDKEDIWRTSPLFDMHFLRAIRAGKDFSRPLFNLLLIAAILFAEFLREGLGFLFKDRIYTLYPRFESPHLLAIAAAYASVYFSITLPLKVWNNTRNEVKLEEQERRLMQARLQALTNQINPHFLFNTLNSITSLIRSDPAHARQMIIKLSSILRRLLRKHESLTSLREELAFVEDYLSIELVRFGDKLRFEADVDPATLDMLVPSMLLQPLIENSVKHGLSTKVEGGTVRMQTRLDGGRLLIRIEDDGIGIPEPKLARLLETGIGVSNVSERLKVLFGSNYRMWIESQPGSGTRIAIELPRADPTPDGPAAQAAASRVETNTHA